MIPARTVTPPSAVPTSSAHVKAVAELVGRKPLVAGEYLYAVRHLPLLGSPIIYQARVSS